MTIRHSVSWPPYGGDEKHHKDGHLCDTISNADIIWLKRRIPVKSFVGNVENGAGEDIKLKGIVEQVNNDGKCVRQSPRRHIELLSDMTNRYRTIRTDTVSTILEQDLEGDVEGQPETGKRILN